MLGKMVVLKTKSLKVGRRAYVAKDKLWSTNEKMSHVSKKLCKLFQFSCYLFSFSYRFFRHEHDFFLCTQNVYRFQNRNTALAHRFPGGCTLRPPFENFMIHARAWA